MSNPDNQPKTASSGRVAIVVVLSGPRRGRIESLTEKTYRIVVTADEAVLFLEPDDERAQDFHATLHRAADTYEIEVCPEYDVWANGSRVSENQELKAGDLLEIGQGGPVVRYRLYPPHVAPTKTITEVVADSFNGAQADGQSKLAKASRFLTNVVRDLMTQTTLWFRVWILIILTVLVVSVVVLVAQNLRMQQRLAIEDIRIEEIKDMLEQQRSTDGLSREDLLEMQTEVETHLAETMERLQILEASPGALSRVIATATPAVAFLLGAYTYREPDSGRLLRYIELKPGGMKFTYDESAKVVEVIFTGTAFIAGNENLLITNLHVIEPWQEGLQENILQGRELIPEPLRILAYFPGITAPFPLEVVQRSEQLDLALLKATRQIPDTIALKFADREPQPGDEVLLLGYPTGMRALVARTNPEFLKLISPDGPVDPWSVAQRLAEAGYIKPLATRGIVGQVGREFIVYDAETTFGGSGGPVLDLDGRVIAINAAVIPEFGGSNMGVPVERVLRFLNQ